MLYADLRYLGLFGVGFRFVGVIGVGLRDRDWWI